MRTKTLPVFVAAILGCCLLLSACDDVKSDIEDVFQQYMSAVAAGDADKIIALIDPKNLEHYDAVIEAARASSFGQIEVMTPRERIMIGILRATMTAADLKALDARKLMKLEAQDKMNSFDDDTYEFTLGAVKHHAPRATADLVVNGESTGIRVEFVEVENKWVFNNDCMDDWANKKIHEIAKILHMDESSLIIRIVSRIVGREVHLDIYSSPPK